MLDLIVALLVFRCDICTSGEVLRPSHLEFSHLKVKCEPGSELLHKSQRASVRNEPLTVCISLAPGTFDGKGVELKGNDKAAA